ncbi:MAG: undecaprenyl-phosphate glucose phosphotransferase [Anaerolineae bacterium]|nr:undecaprenyl-phosphate glucose phosphotransferase [Anaerolineae bacterium]
MAASDSDVRLDAEGRAGTAAGTASGDTAFRDVAVSAAPRNNRVRTLLNLLQPVVDVLMLTLAFALGYIARIQLPLLKQPNIADPFTDFIPTLILHVVVIIGILYLSRLYHLPRAISRIDHARKVIGVLTVGSLMVYGLQAILFNNTIFAVDYPRALLFYVWIFSMVLTVAGREVHQSLRYWLRTRKLGLDNLLIVGNGKIAREIARKITTNTALGYNPVGVVVNGKTRSRGNVSGIPVIGVYHDLPALIDRCAVDQVVIALPDAQRAEIVELISLCQRGRVDIKIYPDMFAYMAGDLSVDDLSGTPLLTVRDIAMRGWRLSLKRGMDIIGAGLGMIFLSPLMLLTAVAMRLESEGPVFYTQERMGLDGKPFHMVKFRTMRQDAEVGGPGWTVKDDPRVTRLGHLMRTTNWDEIPQLINVLVGEMSLVGPRPERPVYVLQFRERIPRYMERHREKAGMTGWAQVNGLRGDTSIAERTEYDLWYVENWSLWLDIKIIIRTVWNTFRRRDKNAY